MFLRLFWRFVKSSDNTLSTILVNQLAQYFIARILFPITKGLLVFVNRDMDKTADVFLTIS